MYRELGDIQTDIINKIIEMGAKESVKKISSKKLAKECNISTATIFKKFGTMQNAIDETFNYCENKLKDLTKDYLKNNTDIKDVWDNYMDVLIDNPDITLYILSYISSFKYDLAPSTHILSNNLDYSKSLFKNDKILSDADYLMLFDYMITISFVFAQKFIYYIPYTKEEKERVKKIVFNGYDSLLK